MREHLEYRRFRVWYCSLPAYPPTCLSSNLCIFTILTPTLTHSQAFVLMSPLPNHLSLPPPLLLSPSLLHTPFLFTGQQVLSGCVYSPPPLSYPSLSLRLSFPFSLCLFYVCVCLSLSLSLSLAAGKRREDAITAAHEGGWKKKKKKKSAQGKQLQSPQGCQLQSPQPLAFFNQANRGKTVAVGRHQGLRSISPTWWSQPQRAELTLPQGVFVERSGSLHEKYPLKSTYYHLIISSLKNMSLPNGNFRWRYLHLLEQNTKQRTPSGCFFFSLSRSFFISSLSKSEPCVCVSFSQTASKYMRSALGLLFGPGKVRPASFQISWGGTERKTIPCR